MKAASHVFVALLLTACGSGGDIKGYDGLVKQVENNRVGSDPDQWIEMKNAAGEWERTGLVFGYYAGDLSECLNAIAGLKKVNYRREYRCMAAN